MSHERERKVLVRTSLEIAVVSAWNLLEPATNRPRSRFLFGVQLSTDLRGPSQKNGIVKLPSRFDTLGTHALN
jgi:hypothetical protein